MTNEMRSEIEELINQAWELHDQAQSLQEKEQYTMDVLDLISRLPENVEILRIVQ